jgi:hypothetical protein
LAGDVIFVYSGGKDGFFNVSLQRWVFDSARASNEWFSHVALMLDDGIALETSTQPSANERTWSGATLGGGVRLITLEDLLLGSQRWRVLRSPGALQLPRNTFDIEREYVSGLYGTQYSVKAFDNPARSAAPLLAWLADTTGQSAGWTSHPEDVASQVGQEFRARVLRDYPDHKFRFHEQTFYCSDLVRVVLSRTEVLPPQDRSVTVTPSALFDQLRNAGWTDVTDSDYAAAAVATMAEGPKSTVKDRYDIAVSRARFFRSDHGFNELWDVVDKSYQRVIGTLEDMQDKLFRIGGVKPPDKT